MRTLNNFRSKLKDDIKEIFKYVVRLGVELEIIDGKIANVDGTQIEANSNRHKFTWKKMVSRALNKIEKELTEITEDLFEYTDKLEDEENTKYGNLSLIEIKEGNSDNYELKILELAKEISNKFRHKKRKDEEEKEIFEKSKRIMGTKYRKNKKEQD